MNDPKKLLFLMALSLALAASGCAGIQQMGKLPEERIPVGSYPVVAPSREIRPEAPADGSLWRGAGKFGSLFVDYKARSLGDIVTISIVEDAKATNNAVTDTGKKSSLSAGLEGLFGYENKYEATSAPNPFSKIAGGMENSFSGTGKTQRSGQIKAEITARVVDVLDNGNLKIEGTREITVNSERQFIILSGIIQPRDISSDNRIASTRIADAKIVYSGVGVVDEQQRQGWLSRLLLGLWPL